MKGQNIIDEYSPKAQQKLAATPYEEYYSGGLSVICNYCDTQIAIPKCMEMRAIQCPECGRMINIIWKQSESNN